MNEYNRSQKFPIGKKISPPPHLPIYDRLHMWHGRIVGARESLFSKEVTSRPHMQAIVIGEVRRG